MHMPDNFFFLMLKIPYSLFYLKNIMKKFHLILILLYNNNKNSIISYGHEIGIESDNLELRIFIVFINNALIEVPVT